MRWGRAAERMAMVLAVISAGCGRSIVRLHSTSAKRHEVALIAIETRTSRVVAFDDHRLPRSLGVADAVVVELLPGGHCVQLVMPRLWSAFDRSVDGRSASPSRLSEAYWFQARAGRSYVLQDFITQAQMLDELTVVISEEGVDGSTRPVGGTMVIEPPGGGTCRPLAPRDDRRGVAAPPALTSPPDADRASRGDAARTVQTAVYKGRTIVWDEGADPPRLVIDGAPVTVYESSTGKHIAFGAAVLSYAVYPTLLQLAQALINTQVVR